ncbi:MAG TPA: hypothetical protein VFI39_11975, partial [Gemmatimonadales bacterium]|nr:hypothetical protein [Gemmatimonadales bacterium]
ANFSNAGSLTGVVNAYEPRSYQTMENLWRNVEGVLAGAAHAADYNLYWGAAGKIDSVIDYTYNSPLPFKATAGATWGVLNAGAVAGGKLATTSFGCVEPLRSRSDVSGEMGSCGTAVNLSQTVVPGPVIFNTGTSDLWAGQTQQPNNGFGLYIAGHIFQFELAGGTVPAAGTVWSLRTYVGAIDGGTDGGTRNFGPYVFTPFASSLNAPGATLSTTITANNQNLKTASGDLSAIHTVPDPYYVTDGFEASPTSKVIKFVNLPERCSIRIYSTSGVLVRILDHRSTSGQQGAEDWDVRNRNNQVVASGVYFYSIESSTGPRVVKRLTIVNFSQ